MCTDLYLHITWQLWILEQVCALELTANIRGLSYAFKYSADREHFINTECNWTVLLEGEIERELEEKKPWNRENDVAEQDALVVL